MKKKIFFAVSFIVGIVLFIGVISGIGLDNIVGIFHSFSTNYILLFLVASISILLGKTYKWQIILRSHGESIGFFRLMMCKLSGIAISFITPIAMMGGGFAMGYLLTKEKVKSPIAISSVVLDKSFELIMSLLFTVFGVIIILTSSAIKGNTLLLLGIMPIIFFLMIFFMYDRIRKKKGIFTSLFKTLKIDKVKWLKKYNKVIRKSEKNVVLFLKENKKESIKALIVTALSWGLMLLEYKFALLAIGLDVNWAVIFATIAVVGLTYSVPIPAALGVLEGGQASLFSAIGLGAGAGVALSLVIRIRDILWTLIGLIYLTLKGMGLAKRNILEDS